MISVLHSCMRLMCLQPRTQHTWLSSSSLKAHSRASCSARHAPLFTASAPHGTPTCPHPQHHSATLLTSKLYSALPLTAPATRHSHNSNASHAVASAHCRALSLLLARALSPFCSSFVSLLLLARAHLAPASLLSLPAIFPFVHLVNFDSMCTQRCSKCLSPLRFQQAYRFAQWLQNRHFSLLHSKMP